MAGSIFGMIVERPFRVRTLRDADALPFDLTPDGFLDPKAVASIGEVEPGSIISLGQIDRNDAIVLLGEPGMGKSTAIDQYLGSLGPSTEVIRLTGPDLLSETFDDLIGCHLQEQVIAKNNGTLPQDAPSVLIVIDQLDESPMLLSLRARVMARVKQSLRGRVGFLVACRTADYPPKLTDAFHAVTGKCVLVDLAPLTQEQATELASSVPGINGDDLIGAAITARCSELASVPLTLELLIRSYRVRGSVVGTTREVFIDGIEALLQDPVPDREAVNPYTVADRLSAARRLAGTMILSGRRAVWAGSTLDCGRPDLNIDACVDDISETHRRLMSAILRTGLMERQGEFRYAFRHSSLAACLAASHLIAQEVPEPQLRQLLTVEAADGSASIPEALRETAAWLVTLAPSRSEWLVDADPQSLAGYSPIVDSPQLRKLIVAGLLKRAGEIELMDVHGLLSGMGDFGHEGLASQLKEAFERLQMAALDWPTQARVTLAVRLARYARLGELAVPLADIAFDVMLPAHVRQQAALAAYAAAPAEITPRLNELLLTLADRDYAAEHDPDDEIFGSLLQMLYPSHVSTTWVLEHLRQHRRDFIGVYRRFLATFTTAMPDDQIDDALDWALEQVGAQPESALNVATAATPVVSELAARSTRSDVISSLIDDIVGKAMAAQNYRTHCESVARVVLAFSRAFEHLAMPSALDTATGGVELTSATERRHALTLALAEVSSRHDGDIHPDMVLGYWKQREGSYLAREASADIEYLGRTTLLDTADFPWIFQVCAEASDNGDVQKADTLAQLGATVFDLADETCAELPYRNQNHPIWPYVNYWFEPMSVDSDVAKAYRERQLSKAKREQERQARQPEAMPEHELQQQLLRLLAAAATHTPADFWLLAWNLQLEPGQGSGPRRFDDDLTDFPGYRLIATEAESIHTAAIAFLSTEQDYSDSWLGTSKYDNRGWAGYLALTLLLRASRLNEIPQDAWINWAGIAVWYDTDTDVQAQRKAQIFEYLSTFAAEQLSLKVQTYLYGQVRRAQRADGLRGLSHASHQRLLPMWQQLLRELKDAYTTKSANSLPQIDDDAVPACFELGEGNLDAGTDTWTFLLNAVWAADSIAATALAQETLVAACTDQQLVPLAVRAAASMLGHDPSTHWDFILDTCQSSETLSRKTALGCASRRDDYRYAADATTQQLGRIYLWLAQLFPPEMDPPRVSGFIGAEQQAREWRDKILSELGSRGTEEAITTLETLKEKFPERLIIDWAILRARSEVHRSKWQPPEPPELVNLLRHPHSKLVRTATELAALVIETIKRIEKDLSGHNELLWNILPRHALTERQRNAGLTHAWRPKLEAALCAYIAHELTHWLKGHGLAINREVMIKPTDQYGAGDRTDILVEASHPRTFRQTQHDEPLRVVIEVKGSWNPGVLTAQQTQLAERYLPQFSTSVGIYIVGCYDLELWTDLNDDRRAAAAGHDSVALKQQLDAQAQTLKDKHSVLTIPELLTITRPVTAAEKTRIQNLDHVGHPKAGASDDS